MDLDEWLWRKKMTTVAFAKLIGISRVYIGQVKRKEVVPGKRLAKDIEALTGGEVKADSFVKK